MFVDYKKIGIRIAQRRKGIRMKQHTLAEKRVFPIITSPTLKTDILFLVWKLLQKYVMLYQLPLIICCLVT